MNRFRRQPRTLAGYAFPLPLSRLPWDNSMVSLDIRSRKATRSASIQDAQPAEARAADGTALFTVLEAASRIYKRIGAAQMIDGTPEAEQVRADFEAALTPDERVELARLLGKIGV